jgi:hypothetical protein
MFALRGGFVLCWTVLRFGFARVATSGVVLELATLPTLIW